MISHTSKLGLIIATPKLVPIGLASGLVFEMIVMEGYWWTTKAFDTVGICSVYKYIIYKKCIYIRIYIFILYSTFACIYNNMLSGFPQDFVSPIMIIYKKRSGPVNTQSYQTTNRTHMNSSTLWSISPYSMPLKTVVNMSHESSGSNSYCTYIIFKSCI